MISVQSVEKRYGELTAVSQLSFNIKQGEIVGLLGHNGAGKTTLMKMITGYLEPSAGQILVDGIDVVQDRISVQKLIGYLPENAPLYPEMQVYEYLQLMAELRGLSGDSLKKAIKKSMESTGLWHRKYDLIATLSKGYKQRVGLAQAILHDPKILILDEPTNGLDPVQILEIRSLIKQLSENTTIILSTHILSEIEAVCDRVVIMIQGELSKDAPIKSFLSSNSIRLKLKPIKENRDVIGVLKRLDHIKTIIALPKKDGIDDFRVLCTKDPSLIISEIAKICVEHQWELLAIHQDVQDLETAFRELMRMKGSQTDQNQSQSLEDLAPISQVPPQVKPQTSQKSQSNQSNRSKKR
jgi:ABC-2 type transport system ATP-binding protein